MPFAHLCQKTLIMTCLLVLTSLAPFPALAGDHGGGGPEPVVFTVNLGSTAYAQFSLLFETGSPEAAHEVVVYRPKIQHRIILLMSDKNEAHLRTLAGKKELDDALEVITRYHNDISILHCVSQYPTQPDNLNLKTITYLKQHYGQYHIGFSDHTIGIAAPVVAVGMGAEIIEKHVTIDRRMKGTDQQGSLGPDGVNRMIRDIRIAEHWLGREELYIDPAVSAAKVKLERSIATNKALHPGDIITEEDIHLLSPGDGFKWAERDKVVGRRVRKEIPRNEIIYPSLIEE